MATASFLFGARSRRIYFSASSWDMLYVNIYVDRVYLCLTTCAALLLCRSPDICLVFRAHVVASRSCVAPSAVLRALARLVRPPNKSRTHYVRGGRSDGTTVAGILLFDHTDTTGVLADWVTNALENTARSHGM
jgi:hypothetical protein